MRNPLDNLHQQLGLHGDGVAWPGRSRPGADCCCRQTPGRWHDAATPPAETADRADGVQAVRDGLIRLPCQIVKSGRRLIYRLLSYNPWQEPLLAGAAAWPHADTMLTGQP